MRTLPKECKEGLLQNKSSKLVPLRGMASEQVRAKIRAL